MPVENIRTANKEPVLEKLFEKLSEKYDLIISHIINSIRFYSVLGLQNKILKMQKRAIRYVHGK